jgi:multidrug efflux pump subunit AcrB
MGEVARVVDGFADTVQFARFQGKPALIIRIFRSGNQSALEIASRVNVERAQDGMPDGVYLTTLQDFSEVLRDRLDLNVT